MNKVKYQIFVSSTYDDLKDERDQVIKAILEMGHIPVGMEMFSAADEEQWQIITRQIDDSDYYVVILANRYGSIVEGIGYTEKEYDYAISKGVPTLGFVLDTKAPWPSDRNETDRKAKTKLEAFKKKVKEKPVNFWTSKEDLHGRCAIALGKTFNTQPRPGWVRSPDAAGPEVAAELSRLSSENNRLREENAILRKSSDTSGFAQGEDEIDITFSTYMTIWTNISTIATWNEIFEIIGRTVLADPKENEVVNAINTYYREIVLPLIPYTDQPELYEGYKKHAVVSLSNEDLADIKTQFLALNLIQINHINHNKETVCLWTLTTQGEKLYALMAAKKRVVQAQ